MAERKSINFPSQESFSLSDNCFTGDPAIGTWRRSSVAQFFGRLGITTTIGGSQTVFAGAIVAAEGTFVSSITQATVIVNRNIVTVGGMLNLQSQGVSQIQFRNTVTNTAIRSGSGLGIQFQTNAGALIPLVIESGGNATFSGNILGGRDTTVLTLAAGLNTADGGNITLRGGTGGSANLIQIRQSATTVLEFGLTGNATFSGQIVSGSVGTFKTIGAGNDDFALSIRPSANDTPQGGIGALAGGILSLIGTNVVRIITNSLLRFSVSQTGIVSIPNLAGTGSRPVLADASGNLSAP